MKRPAKWLAWLCLLVAAGQNVAASDWEVGETYYLYNTDAGQFLTKGNNWGTRASFGSTGGAVQIEALDGTAELYRIKMSGASGLYIYQFWEYKTSNWCSVDVPADNVDYQWQIKKQSNGTWRIGIDPENATYGTAQYGESFLGFVGDYGVMGANNNQWYNCPGLFVHPLLSEAFHSAPGLDWMFLTEEEYQAVQGTVAESYEARKALQKYVRSAKGLPGFTAEELDAFHNPATTKAELEAALGTLPQKMMEYVQAHASEATPMDVTFLLANPSCDDANHTGWTKAGAYSSNGTYHRNGDCALVGRFYEIWTNSTLPDNDLYQNLTGLPSGNYTLGADVCAVQQFQNVPVVTGVNLYAVGAEKQTASCSTADGLPEYFAVNFLVTDGTARVGIENVSTTANWLAMDNFKLYYKGIDLTALQEALAAQIEKAEALLAGDPMPEPIRTELQGAIAEARGAEATEAALTAATNRLTAAMGEAQQAQVLYATLTADLEAAQALQAQSVPDTEEAGQAFAGAIGQAQAALNGASAAADLQTAIDALESARQTYIMQSKPTAGTSYDMTGKVANAKMNGGNTGWQSTAHPGNGNFRVWSDASVNTDAYSGAFYERWASPALADCPAIWQTVTDLPNGAYALTAAAFAEGGAGYSLRADALGTAVTSAQMQYYTVPGVVIDGTLTVALYAEPGNANKWSGLADVSLTYYGEDMERLLAGIDAYKQVLLALAQVDGLPQGMADYLTGELQQLQPESETAQACYDVIAVMKQALADAKALAVAYPALVAYKATYYDEIIAQSEPTEALTTFETALSDALAAANQARTPDALQQVRLQMQNAFYTYLPQGVAKAGRFDLTHFLTNASLSANGAGWNETLGWSYGVAEKFEASFNAHQVLEGMPAGFYTLSVQAAYRTAANETAEADYRNGTAQVLASLYAGDSQKALKNIFDDASAEAYFPGATTNWPYDYRTADGTYMPNSLEGTSRYFAQGLYENTLCFEQTADGPITLGVKAENVPAGTGAWTLFSNFRLLYGAEVVSLNEEEAYAPTSAEQWARVSSNRVIEAGRWSTLWVPFDIPADRLEAFDEVKQLSGVSVEGEMAFVTFVDVKEQGIRAGQPYLVRTNADWTMASEEPVRLTPVTCEPVAVDGATMTCVEAYADVQGVYYVANNSFYLADVPVNSKNYRAVIGLAPSLSVKSVTFGLGQATALEGVEADVNGDARVDVYTLGGVKLKGGVPASRALEGLGKGVYIVNGKKVIK